MATELQLDQMTLEEKLRAMEALWDDLCRRDAVPVPQWHKDILDHRQRLIDEGKPNSSTGKLRRKNCTIG